MKRKIGVLFLLQAAACLLFAGCGVIGPRTVVRDRFDYSTAISDSWKSQMLLNLVKVRYGDTPIFLDVASVISQYTVAGELDLGLTGYLYRNEWLNYAVPSGLIRGNYVDHPTITYSPLTGKKFAQSLMAPIPPAALFNLIESGYPVDIVFRICLHSINGIQNSFGGAARAHPADPEFYPLLAKMRKVQAEGDISIKVEKSDNKESSLMFFRKNSDAALNTESLEIRKMLGLDPDSREFKVIYGSFSSNTKEIAILTRSLLEIITDFSSCIDAPLKHITEKRVNPNLKDEISDGVPVLPLIKIHSSKRKPSDAFVSVPYHKYWFWIDDRDFASKRMLTTLLYMFSLTETGDKEGLPIVTIPTN